MRRAALALVFVALLAHAARAGVSRREPDPHMRGRVYEWEAGNGLVYHYRLPESYDPERGAGLTIILHGSNLDRTWGFANHSPKKFRPDDVVVCPDGTTSNERGGFNCLGRPDDAERFHEFLTELRTVIKVNAVYLYGHSQGSFFALFFAGQYPDDVQGVVGQASGVWTQTRLRRAGHHQAIALMHGTRDPVVPYGQSVAGLTAYRDAKYPKVRLRSLEGWNHWPAEENGKVPHTSQQLAWVEGMTTADPERLAWCLDFLSDVREAEHHDYAAAGTLAVRIFSMREAPEDLRLRAKRVMDAVGELAASHVAAMDLPEQLAFDAGVWTGYLPLFLRQFAGVPACEKLLKEHGDELEKQRQEAVKSLRKHWPAFRKSDFAEAFAHGVAAVEQGFTYHECEDPALLDNLERWAKDARELKLPKDVVKTCRDVVPAFREALTKGWKAFVKVQRKAPELR